MNNDDRPEGLTTEQATALHKGETLQSGPFELSYNDDGAEYYYIRRRGEVHWLNYSFKKVEHWGEHKFNLIDTGDAAGLYLNDIQNFPLLEKAMVTLSRTT